MFEVYGAEWCPFCHIAVKEIYAFSGQRVPIKPYNSMTKLPAYTAQVNARHHTSMPAIFYSGHFVGGLEEFRKAVRASL